MRSKRPTLSETDRSLFRQAVADAKPLPHHGKALPKHDAPPAYPVQSHLDEKEALRESLAAEWTAEDWLDAGDEPNFLRPGLSRQVLRKLRSGAWVIQNELDLHGLDRHEASEALAGFLTRCVKRGIRCVRVIHGKGLGSKNREPVLKVKVKHWLAQRDDVLAYCQARPVDGGSGALLVLLKGAGR
jgi:DNA-nicking Smr family endonuclease